VKLRFLILTAAALLVAGSCSSSPSDPSSAGPATTRPVLLSEPVPVTEPSTTTTFVPDPAIVEQVMATMTLEEKIGQLFMPVMSGTNATSVSTFEGQSNASVFGYRTPAEIVAAYKLGGVIYLGDNIVSADQVGTFSADLQAVAQEGSGIGLLIAVDQEGGRVNHIIDGVNVFPPAAILSGDVDAVREAGYLTGRQVSSQGINVVLAPVADLNAAGAEGAIGSRSYGEDPTTVAAMVTASIDGLQSSGVAAAVKHWPGHGATPADSHVELPKIDVSRASWDARERVPFEAAIDHDVSIVLVGHLAFPSLDPQAVPATVSPALIDELLRDELGFDGVVMTDALNMRAVTGIERGEVVVQAIEAGADIMLVPPDLQVAFPAMIEAVETGRLDQARIDESVMRVLLLKQRLGLLPPL
jgi:beta-N-acetylhexosaminidase